MSGRRRPRPQKRRAGKPRTLRTRLVVASVVLIAVVCAVIGTVTTLALRSHLYEQLDGQLNEVAKRASGRFGPPGGPNKTGSGESTKGTGTGDPQQPNQTSTDISEFVQGPQPQRTIAAKVEKGSITSAVVGKKSSDDLSMKAQELSDAAIKVLGSVAQDSKAHTVDLPGYGEYRVEYMSGDRGSYYVAVPTTDVNSTINTLILVEVSVTAAGLIAASLAGTVIVGVATRPLRKVAATATRVSELPCTPARSTSVSVCPSPRPTRTPRSARSVPRSTGC